MTDLATLTNDMLLAELARKGRALERYERADGQAWYQERQERERTKREYSALCEEWYRRSKGVEQ